MTTIDAAAAKRAKRRAVVLLCTLAAGLGLAGCGTGSGLLDGNGGSVAPQPVANAPAQTGATATVAKASVSIAPVIGAPETVAKQLASAVSASAGKQGVAIVTGDFVASYTLRGYIVAARELKGVKVSYIWDVTNVAGQRVNRITGEETITGANGRDPWVSVSPQIVQTIADKTAASLSTWIAAQPAPAAVPPTAAGTPVAAAPLQAPTAVSAPPDARLASTGASAGATGSLQTSAIVPAVVGAPGDGTTSLSRALQQELQRNGMTLANQPNANSYRVEGKVALGAPRGGKQAIQIDWVVKDPKGAKLGTVSQKNEIPSGSLDGAWGATADTAAAAAAQGILKLIPNSGRRT